MGPVPQPEEDRDRPGYQNGGDIEDAEHPDVTINAASDSDSDEDFDAQGGYVGYQALSQNVDAHDSDTDSDSGEEAQFEAFQQYENIEHVDENTSDSTTDASGVQVPYGLLHQVRHPNYPNVANLPGYMQVPELPRPEKKELLWNEPRHSDQLLDIGHADKIKSVMSGIQMPSSSIPDWAQNLSDDQWQSQIVNKLVNPGTSQKQENSEKHCETNTQQQASDGHVLQNCDQSSSDCS